MSEDQQMVDEGGSQGQNGQTRIIVGNSALSDNGYIVTQEGLALQAVDGQQVIMMNEVTKCLHFLKHFCKNCSRLSHVFKGSK